MLLCPIINDITVDDNFTVNACTLYVRENG